MEKEEKMAEVKIDIKASDNATPAFRAAEESASGLLGALRALDAVSLDKRVDLDVGGALEGARAVVQAIDAIPDTSVKTVILRYQTQASPIRPFGEGIEQIKKKMESLPSGGDYTMRFGSGRQQNWGANSSPAPAQDRRGLVPLAPFSPTINLTVTGSGTASTDGTSLAREIDHALADLWRTNRSELRRAQAL